MGHHNLRYVGDPHADSGIWGSPTSAANFCEEDYAVTSYVAEFVNTLTNIAYVYYALQYPRRTKPGAPWYQGLDFMGVSLICVGICSSLFHGSMRQIPQFLDDLSMFLLAGALLQPLYAANQTAPVRRLVAAVVAGGIVAISVVYVRSGNILIHSISFIVMITFAWPRALYLVHYTGRSEEEKARCMARFKSAFWTLALGYALWNVDLELCLDLRAFRAKLPLPLSWILELHGWWHVLTAMGASHFIRLIRIVTDEEGESARREIKQR